MGNSKRPLKDRITNLPPNAKETYIKGVFVDTKGDIYLKKDNGEISKRTPYPHGDDGKEFVEVRRTTYMRHVLFAEAFVENPYREIPTMRLCVTALNGDYKDFRAENFIWEKKRTIGDQIKARHKLCPICGKRYSRIDGQPCHICRQVAEQHKIAEQNKKEKINRRRQEELYIRSQAANITPQADRILSLYGKGYTIDSIGKEIGISKQRISAVLKSVKLKIEKADSRKNLRKAEEKFIRANVPNFTPRQENVLTLYGSGLIYKDIGKELGITEQCVSVIIKKLKNKAGMSH